jgi:hypothetical protein
LNTIEIVYRGHTRTFVNHGFQSYLPKQTKSPEGYGNTVHCKSSTIRIIVLETFATGKSFVRVPAYPDIQTVSGIKTMRYLITTERVGVFVLLRIEEMNGPTASA